jgi:hypothetical protein
MFLALVLKYNLPSNADDDKDLDLDPILVYDGEQIIEANVNQWYLEWKTVFPTEPGFSVYSQDVIDGDRRFGTEESPSSAEEAVGIKGEQSVAQADRTFPRRQAAEKARTAKRVMPSTIHQVRNPPQNIPAPINGTRGKAGSCHGSLKLQIPQNAAQLSISATQQSSPTQNMSTARNLTRLSASRSTGRIQQKQLTQKVGVQSVLSQSGVEQSKPASSLPPRALPIVKEARQAKTVSALSSWDRPVQPASSMASGNSSSAMAANRDIHGRQKVPVGTLVEHAISIQSNIQVQSHEARSAKSRSLQRADQPIDQRRERTQQIRSSSGHSGSSSSSRRPRLSEKQQL